MTERLAVIGDIHGRLRTMRRLLERVGHSRHLVFVGDYVDGEENPFGVMEELLRLQIDHSAGATFLMGNHEADLMNYLDGGPVEPFLRNGGLLTVHSYLSDHPMSANPLEQFVQQFPKAHLSFLRGLDFCYENESEVISHAGVDPDNPTSRTIESLVFGRHGSLFNPDLRLEKRAIFGHYSQRHEPFVSESAVCVDVSRGIRSGGKLVAFLLPEQSFLVEED